MQGNATPAHGASAGAEAAMRLSAVPPASWGGEDEGGGTIGGTTMAATGASGTFEPVRDNGVVEFGEDCNDGGQRGRRRRTHARVHDAGVHASVARFGP